MQEQYYKEARRLAQKEYRACLSRGQSPCLPVMDDFIPPEKAAAGQSIGLVQVPCRFIVGTRTRGRVNAFAPNFMPMLEDGTEFADKWKALCRSHLKEGMHPGVRHLPCMFFQCEENIRFVFQKTLQATLIAKLRRDLYVKIGLFKQPYRLGQKVHRLLNSGKSFVIHGITARREARPR